MVQTPLKVGESDVKLIFVTSVTPPNLGVKWQITISGSKSLKKPKKPKIMVQTPLKVGKNDAQSIFCHFCDPPKLRSKMMD